MFVLDPRLQQDTHALGDFPLSRLLLSNDARYPWFILVPRRASVSEVFELSADEQRDLWDESVFMAQVLKAVFTADKVNVAALGNVVNQMHMHVIGRYRTDDAWPAPVWGRHPARPYAVDEIDALRERLRAVMPDSFEFSEA